MPTSHQPKHFAFVDALRGWAFLGVLVYHASNHVAPPRSVKFLSDEGRFGVQLFYVVSAFTLLWSLENRSAAEKHPVRNFALRRLFRIAPAFWMVAVGYLWLQGTEPRHWAPWGVDGWQILSTFSFTHGWHPTCINGIVKGGWSVAIEMAFYLILPFCFWWIKSLNQAVGVFLVSCGVSRFLGWAWLRCLAPTYSPEYAYLNDVFVYFWLPAQLPVFTLGFVLYFLLRDHIRSHRGGSQPVVASPEAPAVSGPFLLFVAGFIGWAATTWDNPVVPIQAAQGLSFVFLAWALAIWPNRLWVNGATRYLGKISYSAYLSHFVVLDFIDRVAPAAHRSLPSSAYFFAHLVVALTTTVAVATVMYHAIEQPGQWLGRRLIRFLEEDRQRLRPELASPAPLSRAA